MTKFDRRYEAFKKSLPVNLTNKQYEQAIREWLDKNEKGVDDERMDFTT